MRRPPHLKRYQCRSLRMFQRSAAARARFADRFVRIWAGEHGAYWRRGVDGRSAGNGYTVAREEAGIVPLPEALALTCHCGFEKDIWFEFVSARQAVRVLGDREGGARGGVVDLARAERDLELADFVDDYAAAIERGLPLAQNPHVWPDEVRGLLVVFARGLASSIRAGLVEGRLSGGEAAGSDDGLVEGRASGEMAEAAE